MLKTLTMGTVALLLWWPSMAHEQQTPANHKDEKSQNAPAPVPPTHVVIEPSPAIEHLQNETNDGQNQPTEKPLPRFARSEWVIVYITAVYVIIAAITLGAIKKQAGWMKEQTGRMSRQADLMNRQNMFARESIVATRNAADAAKLSAESTLGQFQAMKAKERARIWIGIDGDLNLGMGPMSIPVTYVVTQTGPTDGFVYTSLAKLVVSDVDPEIPPDSAINSIGIPNRVPSQFEKKVQSVFLYRFSSEEIESINAKTMSAYFIALIKYRDIFGDPHETSIMKRWNITDLKNIMGGYGNFAYWTPCGPPEANHET